MEINEDILIRYIDGMLTEEEAVEVKNWRAASLENEKLLEQVYFTAQVASRLKVMRTVNPDEALSRFKSRIHKKEKRLALRQVLGVIQRAAAVLFIPVFLLSAYLFIQQGQGNVRTLAVRTNPGVVSAFDLPDGSKVWLNANSELRYPSDFNADTRTVELTGQGYFEVTKNAHKPFIVKADKDYSVEVLGTSFNVEAFEKDDFVSTTLIEGKVRFDYMKNRQSTAVLMKPGQKLTYDSSSSRIQLIETNGESEIAWKDGKVVFHATPLPEALRMLEKRFNVTFVLSNERLRSEAFTGSFSHQRLERILEIFKISSNIKWRYLDTQDTINEKTRIEIY